MSGRRSRVRRALPASFYARSAVEVAPDLLGKLLCRLLGDRVVRLPITEVEAYHGFLDRASHAHRGQTPRNAVMFGESAHWYVYLCYGIHWMLNVVTDRPGTPSAVLIRGVAGLARPGVLTRELQIDRRLDGRPATRASGLWIEDGAPPTRGAVRRTARIGVGYAGPGWSRRRWRFLFEAPPVSGRGASADPRRAAADRSSAASPPPVRTTRPSRRG